MERAIRFHFDLDKAVGAMAYIIKTRGPTDKAKLMKLLYLADRASFLERGHPITGDTQYAMKHGPVPSGCLDAIDGNVCDSGAVFQYLHVNNTRVELRAGAPPLPPIGVEEAAIIDRVLAEHGHKDTWVLVRETHKYPEYLAANVPDTSNPIPYELILEHYGNETQFRNGRPVISAAMASKMQCPFPRPGADADL